MHDMCGVHYRGALLLSQVAGLPMSALDNSGRSRILARDGLSANDTKRTSLVAPHMSAFGGKADMTFCTAHVRF